MPITPLHAGILAPVNHWFPGKVSNVSFILVNLWIDHAAILYTLFGIGAIDHGINHSFFGTIGTATVVAMFGFKSAKWGYGAFLGGVSHTLLDMLVHADMHPFEPVFYGNPYYMDWMQPLSLVLLPFTVWLIVQYVSYSRGWIQRVRGVAAPVTVEPSTSKL